MPEHTVCFEMLGVPDVNVQNSCLLDARPSP